NGETEIDIQHIESIIQEINDNGTIQITSITKNIIDDIFSLEKWLSEIKHKGKELFKALCIEEQIKQNQLIKEAIETRCNNIDDNPSRMINSILDRHKKPLIINKIIESGENEEPVIYTETEEIMDKTRKYFRNTSVQRQWDRVEYIRQWSDQYTPRNYINEDWYEDLMTNIPETELQTAISECANNKAAGPSGITYELIKHTTQKFRKLIRKLLNKCITTQTIPKEWKNSFIFPIPKKEAWDGNL